MYWQGWASLVSPCDAGADETDCATDAQFIAAACVNFPRLEGRFLRVAFVLCEGRRVGSVTRFALVYHAASSPVIGSTRSLSVTRPSGRSVADPTMIANG